MQYLADPFYWMYSGGEQKIDKLIRKNSTKFIHHAIKHVIRVYPDISRVCSSNYIPMVTILLFYCFYTLF